MPRGVEVSASLLEAGRADSDSGDPPPPRCGVRALLLAAICAGVMTQTALRSVPNLVMNGESGMANEFNWDNAERGAILAAFGWGYTLTQIPGGAMSQVLGPRLTLFYCVVLGSLAGLGVPEGSRLSFIVPLALNFIIGMAQGPVFPVLNGMLAKWLRPDEMARGNALMGSAWNMGQVIQYLLSPLLLLFHSWPLTYYFYASLGLVWCFWWLRAAADAPEEHPRITSAELGYIRGAGNRRGSLQEKPQLQKGGGAGSGAGGGGGTEFSAALFGRICCQKPVLVVSLCAALDGLGGAYANWLPQYYNTQLHYDLQSTGIMVALPMVIAIFSMVLGGLAADAVLARGYALTRVRRWFNLVPTLIIAGCTLSLVVVRDPTAVVAIMSFSNFANGFKAAGIGPVTMELSCVPSARFAQIRSLLSLLDFRGLAARRKYAAAIMGCYNCAANITYYALANNLIGWWLDVGRCPSDDLGEEPLPEDVERCDWAWRWLFAGSAGIFVAQAIIFSVGGTADNIDHVLERRPLRNAMLDEEWVAVASSATLGKVGAARDAAKRAPAPAPARGRVAAQAAGTAGGAGLASSGYAPLGGVTSSRCSTQ